MQDRERKETNYIPDELLGNLLAAIGNNEAKALTLILMRSDEAYSKWDLNRLINESQGNNSQWQVDGNPFKYCKNSLYPIGLVAHPIFNDQLEEREYAKTKLGEEIGTPLAALLLSFSEKWDLPLFDLFGGTVSSKSEAHEIQIGNDTIEYKKRSALTRVQIFRELYTSPEKTISVADLRNRLNYSEDDNISSHILQLKKTGLIYEEFLNQQPTRKYKMLPELNSQKFGGLRGRIIEVLQQHTEPLTFNELIDLLKTDESHYGYVRTTLANWQKAGFVYGESKQAESSSLIQLNENHREMIGELIQLIDDFQNLEYETIQKGLRLTHEIRLDTNRVGNLMARAKNRSPRAKDNLSGIEIKNMIYEIIANSETPLSSSEIQDVLSLQHNLTRHTVMLYLREMSADTQSTAIKKSRKKYYVTK